MSIFQYKLLPQQGSSFPSVTTIVHRMIRCTRGTLATNQIHFNTNNVHYEYCKKTFPSPLEQEHGSQAVVDTLILYFVCKNCYTLHELYLPDTWQSFWYRQNILLGTIMNGTFVVSTYFWLTMDISGSGTVTISAWWRILTTSSASWMRGDAN